MKKIYFLSGMIIMLMAGCQNASNSSNSPANTDSTKPATNNDPGWVALFDGISLKGWHTYGKLGPGSAWNVDSGSVHLQSAARNGYQTAGGGDLITDAVYDNFDLKLEWKISKKGNSGIIFYVQEDTSQFKETWNTGPEMQVCDKDSNEDAHSFKHEAGDLYDLIPSTVMSAKGWGEWNQVEIVSNNGKLDLYLNGVHIISTTLWDDQWKKLIAGSKFKNMPGFGTFKSGHIALQDHG
ncbi:MAG TPA: DUF1080 domain-containing protein, partial [Puia sp.]|nr:DUF1080 domain-containing protein [Puia sp.]